MTFKRHLSPSRVLGVGIFLASLGLYLSTVAPTLTWRNMGSDAGDLVTAAHTLGIPHPPGYPTYVLLLKPFSILVPIGDVAFRANLFSAILASITVLLLFYTLLRLMRMASAGQEFAFSHRAYVSAALATVAFAVSPLFWSQALIAEVYSLNAAFAAGLLYIAVDTYASSTNRGKVSFSEVSNAAKLKGPVLFFLVLGLGLGNHLSLFLVAAPLALWLAYALGWRRVAHPLVLVALLLGLAVYLYLPLRALQSPPINWGDPDNIRDFWWMVRAELYQQYFLGLPISELPARLSSWADLFLRQFTPIGVIFGFLGGYHLWVRARPLLLVGIASLALLSAYSVTYNTPDSFVYMIPGFYIVAIWMGLGVYWSLTRASQLWRERRPTILSLRVTPAMSAMAIAAVALLAPAITLALNYGSLDLSDDREARDYSRELFRGLPQGALVLANTQKNIFSLWYMRHVESPDTEVTVVAVPLLTYDWYWEDFLRDHPLLQPENSLRRAITRMTSIVDSEVASRPVYLTYKDVAIDRRYHLKKEGQLYRVDGRK